MNALLIPASLLAAWLLLRPTSPTNTSSSSTDPSFEFKDFGSPGKRQRTFGVVMNGKLLPDSLMTYEYSYWGRPVTTNHSFLNQAYSMSFHYDNTVGPNEPIAVTLSIWNLATQKVILTSQITLY